MYFLIYGSQRNLTNDVTSAKPGMIMKYRHYTSSISHIILIPLNSLLQVPLRYTLLRDNGTHHSVMITEGNQLRQP